MNFVRVLVSLLLCAVLATACANSDEPAGPPPFDAVLIELFGTDDTDAYLADAEQTAAGLVMACMNEAGFEFEISPVTESFDPPAEMDLEAAAADGFGIIAAERVRLENFDPFAPPTADPNRAYLLALTSAEVDRFLFTLTGPEAEPGQRQQGGCNTQASGQAYFNWILFSNALPNFTVLGEERDTHPDWVLARADWRACMVERGFDYSEPDAIRTDVISLMRETVNAAYPGGQLPLVEIDGGFEISPEVDILLEELAQFERDAAVANIECTEPIASRFDDVERLVQREFVDRNQETIDALLDAAIEVAS